MQDIQVKNQRRVFMITNRSILPLSFLIFLGSCQDDATENARLRDILVEFSTSIDLNDPDYQGLVVPNAFRYIEGGRRGVVLINLNGEIAAYERNCTFLPQSPCARIKMHATQTFFVDSCCGSQFSFSGEVQLNPASEPLVQYRTFLQGSELFISHP